MTEFSHYITQVDAFTNVPLSGNPCAVVFGADDLSSEQMQSIALEMNLSETAFVLQSDKADFRFRFFTPAEEIPLAGHPTIATVHSLIDEDCLQLTADRTTITVELAAGVIEVEVQSQGGAVQQIVMSQLAPRFMGTSTADAVMPAFNLTPDDCLPDVPLQIVSTGTPQLMIPLKDHDRLRRAQVNIPLYVDLRAQLGFFSAHLFCLQGATAAGDTFARHFGTPPDIPEDPFTGSGTGNMGAYLWHHGLIAKSRFVAEQGHWMGRPGTGYVEVVGSPDGIETVKVGGQAVTVMRGHLRVK